MRRGPREHTFEPRRLERPGDRGADALERERHPPRVCAIAGAQERGDPRAVHEGHAGDVVDARLVPVDEPRAAEVEFALEPDAVAVGGDLHGETLTVRADMSARKKRRTC